MKKYKIIKKFPQGFAQGTILYWNGAAYSPFQESIFSFYSKEDVESNPEYFAPFWKITLDGIDLYVGDVFYYISKVDGTVCQGVGKLNNSEKYDLFSTREAGQQYLDSQKPKFEKGEWLSFDNDNFYGIFRFDSINEYGSFQSNEKYWFIKQDCYSYKKDECYTLGGFDKGWNIKKATPNIIEQVLSKVAIYKGFKEGVKFKNAALDGHIGVCGSNDFKYGTFLDGIYPTDNNDKSEGWVYTKGKWATIVEDVPKYVECIKEDTGIKVGKIYKVEEYRNTWLGQPKPVYYVKTIPYFASYFKPSSMDAYNKQGNKLLETNDWNIPSLWTRVTEKNTFTIALENGYEVNSVGFDKNEIKINYQVK